MGAFKGDQGDIVSCCDLGRIDENGEIEYRATLTRNQLLGMVVFLNTTTLTNRQDGEDLFDSLATGGGAGLRLLINKRSRTNLCFDVGVGKQGSKGVYLAIQEAF